MRLFRLKKNTIADRILLIWIVIPLIIKKHGHFAKINIVFIILIT